MDATVEKLQQFIEYAQTLKGDEKGEAQVFCDRLLQAFGHAGYKEAGGTLEERVKRKGQRTKFADLVWKPRLLLEMKSRGEKLERHYRQAFEYWLSLVPQRPRYIILCNFDEFWIYDFDLQLDTPVDKLSIEELPQRYTALNFLFPVEKKPLFGNDRIEPLPASEPVERGSLSRSQEGGEEVRGGFNHRGYSGGPLLRQ
jgi:hypothetical protein